MVAIDSRFEVTLKVAMNELGGYRNEVSVALTGLDVEAKAQVASDTFWTACPYTPDDFASVTERVERTDKADPTSNQEATAIWRLVVKDPDERKVGRAFTGALVETALSSIPGLYSPSGGPGGGGAFGVYRPAVVAADLVPNIVTVSGGSTAQVDSTYPGGTTTDSVTPRPGPDAEPLGGPTSALPLGTIVGARSGDKGGDANLGVFVRADEAWPWLDAFLTVDRLRQLLPEAAGLPVDRYALPNLRAINFVIRGLLDEGVAASTRSDAQAKSLGEWLRARVVDIPDALLG